MLPSTIVERQSKLGVSVEESKAQRLKRQQARFRDRGGAFVPSKSNPLIDILLARTVSGESPSKARPKGVATELLPPAKTHRTSSTRRTSAATVTEESHAEAGTSRSKLPTTRKRTKAIKSKADAAIKPAPKRPSRSAKGKPKVLDADSDPEQPLPVKSRSKSKGKVKQRDVVPSASNEKPKVKTKSQARTKPNPAKEMVEVLVSDDDRTLVDVPHKTKPTPNANIRYEDDSETDNDAPIVRKRATSHADVSKAPGPKTVTRVNIEEIASTKSSSKKTSEATEGRSRDGEHSKTDAKKQLVMRDNDDNDNATAPPAKKGTAVKSTSAKRKKAVEPVPVPMRTPKGVKNEGKPKATDKGKGKYGVEPGRDVVEPMDENDERLPQHVSKLKKRKKEDDYDDRPRKVVKFSEPWPHSSSRKLKENQSDKKHNGPAKLSVEDEPDDVSPLKLAIKPPRAKTPKGPPREVLERIKASAVRYLRYADSEPDELDCLS